MQHHGRLALDECRLADAPAAFQYRVQDSDSKADNNKVRLTVCKSRLDCARVWHDEARPVAVEDRRNKIVFFTSSAEGTPVQDYSLASYT